MKREEDRAGTPDARRPAAGPAATLDAGGVALWRVALDAQPEDVALGLRGLLSADEQTRARQFYFDRDRRRYAIGRGVLRALLGRYLGCDPAQITFRYGPNGKPELADPVDATLRFNVAHSEGMALFAFSRAGEIGVDLEQVRVLPEWEFIASTCFSPEERARVEKAAPEERLMEFFAAWTRQEAVLKATGRGLGGEVRWTAHPRSGPASPAPAGRRSPPAGTRAARLRHRAGGEPGHHANGASDNPAFPVVPRAALRLFPVRVGPGFAATVVVGPAARWATCQTWPRDSDAARTHPPGRLRRIRLNQANPNLVFP